MHHAQFYVFILCECRCLFKCLSSLCVLLMCYITKYMFILNTYFYYNIFSVVKAAIMAVLVMR